MNGKYCVNCQQSSSPDLRFCQNCGTEFTTANNDPPPTVVGGMPPAQNQFQPPSYTPSSMPLPPPPQMPPHQMAQGSGGKKIALIGGIVAVIIVLGIGVALFIKVAEPYFTEQKRLKKESENQTRANSTAAISLLPEEYTAIVLGSGKNSHTFRKNRTLDRLQLLEVSQKLPPKLREAVKDVNDGAAAEYVSTTDPSRKVLLQIYKFNSPAQAVALCDEIGRELQSKKSSFKDVNYSPANSNYPTDCGASARDGNDGLTGVSTLYGFFMIYSGRGDDNPKEARNQVGYKLGV